MELRSLYREPEADDSPTFGALEFNDVYRIFRSATSETVALRGFSLRVEPGELIAVLGPSGSGKSTVLNLAAGLDEPSAGDVLALGRSLARLTPVELAEYRAEQVAIVFQSGNLWPELSARDNVAIGLLLGGKPHDLRTTIDDALDAFDLKPRGKVRAGSLSGGEQQRVAIAAAAARRAPLVLADEPTAELDLKSEQAVLDSLTGLREQVGCTIVVVTHSPRVASAADRVIEIRDGRAT